MRLKTFHASTMTEAMEKVRSALGPDALILSVDEGKSGGAVSVTAAYEGQPTPPVPAQAPETAEAPPQFERTHPFAVEREYDEADLAAVISHHDFPVASAQKLIELAHNQTVASLPEALAKALENFIKFAPLTTATARPIMLVGPPGAGKTVCSAKLVADVVLDEKSLKLITIDTVKAGGVAQLDHFAQLMKQTVRTASSPAELKSLIETAPTADVTLIDTFGVNPFDMQELELLLSFIRAVDVEPILVLPAGLDPLDSQEISGIFNRMGCGRFIATRLDAARRYASVILAARPGFLAIAGFSRSPYIAEGLEQANALSLARLLTALPRPGPGLAEGKTAP